MKATLLVLGLAWSAAFSPQDYVKREDKHIDPGLSQHELDAIAAKTAKGLADGAAKDAQKKDQKNDRFDGVALASEGKPKSAEPAKALTPEGITKEQSRKNLTPPLAGATNMWDKREEIKPDEALKQLEKTRAEEAKKKKEDEEAAQKKLDELAAKKKEAEDAAKKEAAEKKKQADEAAKKEEAAEVAKKKEAEEKAIKAATALSRDTSMSKDTSTQAQAQKTDEAAKKLETEAAQAVLKARDEDKKTSKAADQKESQGNSTKDNGSILAKIYYVNLDRRADRKVTMERQLSVYKEVMKIGVERVPAVDGRILNVDNLINTGQVTARIKERIEFGPSDPEGDPRLTLGATALSLTYREICKKVQSFTKPVLVMEDDAVLADGFGELLKQFLQEWSQSPEFMNAHIIYLGGDARQLSDYLAWLSKMSAQATSFAAGGVVDVQKIGAGMNVAYVHQTTGFVLTPKGARHLLETALHLPLDQQIDSDLVQLQQDGRIESYWLQPPLISQEKAKNEGDTDIQRLALKDMQHLSVLPPGSPSRSFSLIPAFVAKGNSNTNAVVNKTNMIAASAPHQRFLNHTSALQ